MKKFMLIGEKLGHSYSKEIHESFKKYSYELCELSKEQLPEFMANPPCDGFNVTIPYKKEVMKYLDEIDEKAKAIGSVNTVIIKDGKKFGYNTDFSGMTYMLKRANISLSYKKVMILGTGGTSETAKAVAEHYNAKEVVVVSRSGEINYANYADHKDADIIINTTPVGMFPNVNECKIDLNKFDKLSGVVDVIYNPLKTKMLFDAEKLHIQTANGLAMLVAQAKYACDLFTNTVTSDEEIEKVLVMMKKKLTNIVLIGMPGSGKSSVGELLAEKLGRAYYDTDEILEERERRHVVDIFAYEGEDYFRKAEAKIVKELGMKNSSIIAMGGGVVKLEKNYNMLRQNSFVVYIDREIDRLSMTNRPLSRDFNSLIQMYKERESNYHNWSDLSVPNHTSIDDCAKNILEKFNESFSH